jgi:hypothetical protein
MVENDLRAAAVRAKVVEQGRVAHADHTYLFHPLYQNEYMLHPSSLLRLTTSRLEGADTAYAYLKFGQLPNGSCRFTDA